MEPPTIFNHESRVERGKRGRRRKRQGKGRREEK